MSFSPACSINSAFRLTQTQFRQFAIGIASSIFLTFGHCLCLENLTWNVFGTPCTRLCLAHRITTLQQCSKHRPRQARTQPKPVLSDQCKNPKMRISRRESKLEMTSEDPAMLRRHAPKSLTRYRTRDTRYPMPCGQARRLLAAR